MATPLLNPTAIRQDVVARLIGHTPAGEKVFDSRRANYETEELPAITVTSLGGTDDRWSIGTLLVKHTERIAIVGDVSSLVPPDVTKTEAVLAAELDILEASILDALAGDPEWVGAFDAVEKVDSAKRLDDSTGVILGHVAIVLEVRYALKYAPAQEPGPLDSVWVDTHSDDPAGANVTDRPLLDTPEKTVEG